MPPNYNFFAARQKIHKNDIIEIKLKRCNKHTVYYSDTQLLETESLQFSFLFCASFRAPN